MNAAMNTLRRLLPGNHSSGADALYQALREPDTGVTSLLAELTAQDQEHALLLITSPSGSSDASRLAGSLAHVAAASGLLPLALVDLRPVVEFDSDDVQEAAPSTDADGGFLSSGTLEISSHVRLVRPTSTMWADRLKIMEALRTLRSENAVTLLLCDGALDPSGWYADPLNWAPLEPQAVVACSAASHSRDIVHHAGQRLRRGGMPPAGGVFLSQPSMFGLRRQLARFLPRNVRIVDHAGVVEEAS